MPRRIGAEPHCLMYPPYSRRSRWRACPTMVKSLKTALRRPHSAPLFEVCRARARREYEPRPTEERSAITAPAVVAYTVGACDEYGMVGPSQPLYDHVGNMIAFGGRRFRYDAYGRIAEGGLPGHQTMFSYDAVGRLRSLTRAASQIEIVHVANEMLEWRSLGVLVGQLVSADGRICHAATAGVDEIPLSDLAGSVIAWVDSTGKSRHAANTILSVARYFVTLRGQCLSDFVAIGRTMEAD